MLYELSKPHHEGCICHTARRNHTGRRNHTITDLLYACVGGSKDFHHIQNFNSAQCMKNIMHCLSVLYAHTSLFSMQYALYSIVKSFDPPTQYTINACTHIETHMYYTYTSLIFSACPCAMPTTVPLEVFLTQPTRFFWTQTFWVF